MCGEWAVDVVGRGIQGRGPGVVEQRQDPVAQGRCRIGRPSRCSLDACRRASDQIAASVRKLDALKDAQKKADEEAKKLKDYQVGREERSFSA